MRLMHWTAQRCQLFELYIFDSPIYAAACGVPLS